jgi:hypothetical protein
MKPTALMPAPPKSSPPGLELCGDVVIAPKETLTHAAVKMADQRSAHRFVQLAVLLQFGNKPVRGLKNTPQPCRITSRRYTVLALMLDVDTASFPTVSYFGTRKQGSPDQFPVIVENDTFVPSANPANKIGVPQDRTGRNELTT